MAFSDEIQKVSSERFVIARLEPARFINDDLSNPSSNVYTTTLTGFIVSKVQRSGADLTEVADTPNSNGEWNFNESTGVLTIYSTSAPNTTTNVFVVFHYLFYSTDYDREYPEDVTSGDTRLWQGRITKVPSVSQSIKNGITSAQITSSTSNLSLANADDSFQSYLGLNDSFANKSASSWMVVNNQIQKIFEGKITAISAQGENVTINLNDSLNIILNEPAYLGEDVEDVVASTSKYSNLRKSDIGKPIPIIYGRSSKYNLTQASRQLSTDIAIAFGYRSYLDYDSPFKGINTDTTTSSPLAKNWDLCRVPIGVNLYSKTFDSGDFPQNVTFEEIQRQNSAVSETQLGVVSRGGIVLSGFDYDIEIGDTMQYTHSGTDYDAVITGIQFSTTPDETTIYFVSEQVTTSSPLTITAAEITANPSIVIWNSGASETYDHGVRLKRDAFILIPNRDYTWSYETLNNSKLIKVALTSTWASTEIHIDNLTPDISAADRKTFFVTSSSNDMELVYKIHTDDALSNHSDAVKHIVESNGLSTESTSFAASQSDFDADVQMSIPLAGETSYSPLKTYIEIIMRSALSTIYSDSDSKIVYKIFEAPSTGGTFIDENIFTKPLDASLDYRDITTSYRWFNNNVPHYGIYTNSYITDATSQNYVAQHLHQTSKSEDIEHVLRDITKDSRYLLYVDVKKNRFVTYSFVTTSINLLTDILNDIDLNDSKIFGSDVQVDTKVISYTKDSDETQITVTDLLGL